MQPRPNIQVRAIARSAIAIRQKLLIAFLGIAISLAGLAVFGLSALQQANARTEQLLQDQTRIAVFSELEAAMVNITMMAFASSAFEASESENAKFTWQSDISAVLASRMGDIQILLGQSIRRLGGTDSADGARLIDLRSALQKIAPLVGQIRQLRKNDDLASVKSLVSEDFAPVALRFQRETFAIKRQIEGEMTARARVTAKSFETSRQNVIASALIALGVAMIFCFCHIVLRYLASQAHFTNVEPSCRRRF